MAPYEYTPMYPGPYTGSVLKPQQPGYIIVRYSRSISDGMWSEDPQHDWREVNNVENTPEAASVADSQRPFAVSPKRRIATYAQAARCRMTQVRRSEVWVTDRKAFRP